MLVPSEALPSLFDGTALALIPIYLGRPQSKIGAKLLSAYYVACYLGGFSVPLLLIGILLDAIGPTGALARLTGAGAIGATWTSAVGLRSLSGLRAGGPVGAVAPLGAG